MEDWDKLHRLFIMIHHHGPLESDSNKRQERIENVFQILDHLCQPNAQPNSVFLNVHHSKDGMPEEVLPLRSGALMGALTEWKRVLLLDTRLASRSSGHQSRSLSTNRVLELVTRCTHRNGVFEPHVDLFHIIFSVMAKLDDLKLAFATANQVFEQMRDYSLQHSSVKSHPNAETIHHILDICARSGLADAADRAEEYLTQLKLWHEETGYRRMKPSAAVYCGVMEAHSASGRSPQESFDRIHELFEEMQQTCDSKTVNTRALTRVCYSFANCGHPNSIKTAEGIMSRMIDSEFCPPDGYTFSVMLSAYVRSGLVTEARQMLDVMEQTATTSNNPSLLPNSTSYHSYLLACAKAGAPQKAEEILPKLAAAIEREEGTTELYEETLASIMKSWAQSGDENAIGVLAAILRELERTRKAAGIDEPLSAAIYNPVLLCYSQHPNPDLGFRLASDLFHWMKNQKQQATKPNSESYVNMMIACRNSRRPDDCERHLFSLIKQVNGGSMGPEMKSRKEGENAMTPQSLNHQHFNIAISAWGFVASHKAAQSATNLFETMKRLGFDPDLVSYNSLIACWSKQCSRDANAKVDQILNELIGKWKQGDIFLKPDHATFRPILLGLGTPGEFSLSDRAAGQRMETILDIMDKIGITPNNEIFKALMAAWKSRDHPDLVEYTFQRMHQGFKTGHISLKPDFAAHFSRLNSWASAGNPEMAIKALEDMKSASENGELGQKPTTRDFNAVLEAWMRSSREDAADEAESFLLQMGHAAEEGHFDCDPDIFSYGTVFTTFLYSKMPVSGDRVWDLFMRMGCGNAGKMSRYASILEPGPSPSEYFSVSNSSEDPLQSKKEDTLLQPNEVIYSKVIAALLRAGDEFSLERANRLHSEMLQKGLSPSSANCMMLIDAWVTSPEAPNFDENALSLLMKGLDVAFRDYVALVFAFMRSESDDGVKERAVREILDEMLRKPDSFWRTCDKRSRRSVQKQIHDMKLVLKSSSLASRSVLIESVSRMENGILKQRTNYAPQ